jgi:hypothetical protein
VALTEFVICGMYYEVCVDWPRCFTSRFPSVFVSDSVFNWCNCYGSVFRAIAYFISGCGLLGVKVVEFAPICSLGNEPLFL